MADELTTETVESTTEVKPQAGDDFDPERAKALIAKLRGEEKRAKQLEKELAQIRQADEERKLAEMSQLEQLQAKLQKEADARQRLEQEFANQMRKNAVITAAVKAGMHDPDDAVAILANVDTENLGDALDTLKKSKPYLFKSSTPGAYSPTNPAGGAGKQSEREILAEIYGTKPKTSGIWGGPGGGVVWTSNTTE
jgi:hypothetical protein